MPDHYTVDQTFTSTDFAQQALDKGEYENCVFSHCNFSELDLSGCKFIDCEFRDCNLSLAQVGGTIFRDAIFRNCKMLGLRFDKCNPFGLSFQFDGCQLNHSSFYRAKIRNTQFRKCQLQEVDFVETDLTDAVFDSCDLTGAMFENTILERADLSTAINYAFDPSVNKVRKARFSVAGLPGLLHQFDIRIEN